MTAENS